MLASTVVPNSPTANLHFLITRGPHRARDGCGVADANILRTIQFFVTVTAFHDNLGCERKAIWIRKVFKSTLRCALEIKQPAGIASISGRVLDRPPFRFQVFQNVAISKVIPNEICRIPICDSFGFRFRLRSLPDAPIICLGKFFKETTIAHVVSVLSLVSSNAPLQLLRFCI